MPSRFVVISRTEFEELMDENLFQIWNPEIISGEYIYSFSWNDDNYLIKIFSSVEAGYNQTRKKGTDAIRLVLFAFYCGKMKPVWTAPKTLRTKNWRTILERKIIMALEKGCDGMDWECPKCGSPLILRENKEGNAKFYGCSAYFDTKCRGTRPYNV